MWPLEEQNAVFPGIFLMGFLLLKDKDAVLPGIFLTVLLLLKHKGHLFSAFQCTVGWNMFLVTALRDEALCGETRGSYCYNRPHWEWDKAMMMQTELPNQNVLPDRKMLNRVCCVNVIFCIAWFPLLSVSTKQRVIFLASNLCILLTV